MREGERTATTTGAQGSVCLSMEPRELVLHSLGLCSLFVWSFVIHRMQQWDSMRPFDLSAGLTLLVAAGATLLFKYLRDDAGAATAPPPPEAPPQGSTPLPGTNPRG